MFLALLIALLTLTPCATNSLFWLGWVSFSPALVTFQLFLLFSSVNLLYSSGIYESILWSFLSVLTLTVGLFIYQLDVFACFLLISETVVIFFMVTFIIHINHTNLFLRGGTSVQTLLSVFTAALFINFYNSGSYFSYYTLWYTSQISSYNDLLAQYVYLYTLNPYLTLIIGVWLLLLTFFLVLVMTVAGRSNNVSAGPFNYFLKNQNLWNQWGSSPFLNFFK